MRKAALVPLVALCFLGACEKDKPTPPQPTTTASSAPSVPPLPGYLFTDAGLFDVYDEDFLAFSGLFGDILPPPNDFTVDLTTTPCGGGCQGDIHIEPSGKVTIKKAGAKPRELNLDRQTLSSISGKVRKSDFFSMKEDLGTGSPTLTLTVTMNGQTKKVKHNVGDLIAKLPKSADGGLEIPPERQKLFDIQSHIRSLISMNDPEQDFDLPPALVKALSKIDASAK